MSATIEAAKCKRWQDLTAKQRTVVETMCWLHYQNGRLPTLREIMLELKMKSPHSVVCHIERLDRHGWVKKKGAFSQPSNWRLVVAPPGWVLLPGGGIVPREDVAGLIARLQRETFAS